MPGETQGAAKGRPLCICVTAYGCVAVLKPGVALIKVAADWMSKLPQPVALSRPLVAE
jgi:hypothetical protein